MRGNRATVGAAICLLLVTAACSRGCGTSKPRGTLTDAERAVIAAFTHGTVSRESPIRVQFAEPLAESALVGNPLPASPFRFEPAIAGIAIWTAPNELEFRPGERLPDGQTYSARLDLKSILEEKGTLAHFDFDFAAMRQSFEVAVEGLEAASPDDVKRQRLTGRFVTADVDDASRVEKALTATHGSSNIPVTWTHDSDRRTHAFSVEGILRADGPTTLRLKLDGAPIAVDKRETREIAVPGLNTFTVDQARAVSGREQYVELRFSDPLRSPQNLAGLIQIEKRDDLRFVIAGSIVQVFSGKSFRGDQKLRVASGIRNVLGYPMREARDLAVNFEEQKPQVRFAGNGVIVPTATGLKVPIEAVNLRYVTVEAMRIPDTSMPQFLQVNELPGEAELHRVGRVVWKKILPLDMTADRENRWVPIGLDLAALTAQNPGGMYRLTLSFKREHVIWSCPGEPPSEAPDHSAEAGDGAEQESSNWDSFEEYGASWSGAYQRRHDPCSPSYYQTYYDHKTRVGRNVLLSNLGLLAKAGEDGQVHVIVSDLRSTEPVSGADVAILDYQQQALGTGRTNGEGVATIAVDRKPFVAVVRHGGESGLPEARRRHGALPGPLRRGRSPRAEGSQGLPLRRARRLAPGRHTAPRLHSARPHEAPDCEITPRASSFTTVAVSWSRRSPRPRPPTASTPSPCPRPPMRPQATTPDA